MAPILSLLRSNAGERLRAPGRRLLRRADRGRPLPAGRAGGLPCGFVPALSEDCNGWKGESGLITDVVSRLEGDVTEVDAYVCGPPPMVEAAIALLEAKGVPEAHIYYDKFTTTADE